MDAEEEEEEEEKRDPIPSINETPIKVVDSPSSFLQSERKSSPSLAERNEEGEDRRVNTSTDTSSTVLSDMLNNLSNVVNELGQQLNSS